MLAPRLVLVLVVAALLAGCSASAAGSSNFSLKPSRIGWYAGDTGLFYLNLTPSMLNKDPDFVIDRHFAIEELKFNERGASFGGDYETRDMDDVDLVLVQNNQSGPEFHLDERNPGVEIYVTVPDKLRDSEYTLELKLFQVGWVRSEPFRVDERAR